MEKHITEQAGTVQSDQWGERVGPGLRTQWDLMWQAVKMGAGGMRNIETEPRHLSGDESP